MKIVTVRPAACVNSHVQLAAQGHDSSPSVKSVSNERVASVQVNGITALVCIAVFYAILTYIRLKRLL